MKYIIGSRQSGKTTSLIRTAIKEKRIILTSSVSRAENLKLLILRVLEREPELKEYIKSGESRTIILSPVSHYEITRVIGLENEITFKTESLGYLNDEFEMKEIKREYKELIDDAEVVLKDLLQSTCGLNLDGLSFNINDKMGDSKKKYYFEIED